MRACVGGANGSRVWMHVHGDVRATAVGAIC
jgi:hypothetical protein